MNNNERKTYLKLNFAEWQKLSDDIKVEVFRKTSGYSGEADILIEEICRNFNSIYGHSEGIENIIWGRYHGGDYIIGVTHLFGIKITLPRYFEGVLVMEFIGGIPEKLKKLLGEGEVDKYKKYLVIYEDKIESILKEKNIDFYSTSKEEIKCIINNLQKNAGKDDMDLEYALDERLIAYRREKDKQIVKEIKQGKRQMGQKIFDSEIYGMPFEEFKETMRSTLIKEREKIGHF